MQTEKKKIFISHNSKDTDIAQLIANLIHKLTIKQVVLWFSSDNSAGGGLNPGDEWYNIIMSQITECEVMLVLVTPNSIDRPWIYYESGFAKGIKKPVVPMCVGIERENLKSPLNTFQAYQFTNKNSIDEFLTKIFHVLGFEYDKELSATSVDNCVPKLSSYRFDKTIKKYEADLYELVENLRFDLNQKFQQLGGIPSKKAKKTTKNADAYSVRFSLSELHPKKNVPITRDFIIEISDKDTFQNVTDVLYFNLQDLIKPFTYLENWVIIDNKTKNFIVIREVARRIPAKYLLPNDRTYTIKLLQKPYVSVDSKTRI